MVPSKLNRLTLILLYAALGAGILFMAALPWILPYVWPLDPSTVVNVRYIVYICCWICGVPCALVILFTLIRMMKTLRGDPFIKKNVQYLHRMGLVALVMAALTLLAYFMYFPLLLLIIAMGELLCALFSLTLRNVFQKAVEYREENALTI